jgi:septal ring factor EnvC (AmiA/AmiB activator)
MMWKNILLFLVLCCSARLLAQDADPGRRYYITENQLQSIEQSVEKLETDRRSWESQARGLRSEAVSLNAQLQAERENYSALETSFNRYEASQLKAQAAQEAELQKERLKKKGTETQRNIAVLAAAALLALYLVKLKFKVP